MFCKGEKVFDIRYGWGVVKAVYPMQKYGVRVLFLCGEPVMYDNEGKEYDNELVPLLRKYKYKLEEI